MKKYTLSHTRSDAHVFKQGSHMASCCIVAWRNANVAETWINRDYIGAFCWVLGKILYKRGGERKIKYSQKRPYVIDGWFLIKFGLIVNYFLSHKSTKFADHNSLKITYFRIVYFLERSPEGITCSNNSSECKISPDQYCEIPEFFFFFFRWMVFVTNNFHLFLVLLLGLPSKSLELQWSRRCENGGRKLW